MHGLPHICHAGLPVQLDLCMLQSSMAQCCRWYVALAQGYAAHTSQVGFDTQHALSTRRPPPDIIARRAELREVMQQMRNGKFLTEQRERHKRASEEMTASEQADLESFDAGETQKRKAQLSIRSLSTFRTEL